MNNAVEWIGVITGIAAVYLLYLNHVATWPVGFINIWCFLWMFWNEKLYGDFAVQIIFLVVGIDGWIHWQQKRVKAPSRLLLKEGITLISLTIFMYPFLLWYLKNYTDCSYPLAEAAILDISIIGQFLTALRKIENWFFWLVADFMMIIVYSLKGLYPTAVYAFIIFVLGIFGWLKWRKLLAVETQKTPT